MADYEPETYWTRVAQEIERRGANVVAGDDNPYFRYKRRKFLRRFLDTIDFEGKVVLELGFGPGGNLAHIARNHRPAKLLGVDISDKMLELATRTLGTHERVELRKIDGTTLPFADRSVDLAFTVTVLQHNTDETMFRSLVRELCRVTRDMLVIMEDIGRSPQASGTGDWVGRRMDVYERAFAEHGFKLDAAEFLNTRVSRRWGQKIFLAYQRYFALNHREGERIGPLAQALIGLPMPFTRVLDELWVEYQNLAKMVFRRA